MTELEAAWKLLDSLGFKPILAGIILLYLTKKYLLAGSGAFLSNIFTAWLQEQKDRIAVEVKIEEKLSDLVQKFEQIAEGLWDNRRMIDDKIEGIETLQRENLEVSKTILLYAKKRREDWLRDPEEKL